MGTIRAVVVLADMEAWTNTRCAQEHTYENLQQLHFKLCCFLTPDLPCRLRCKVTNYTIIKKNLHQLHDNADDNKTCQMCWGHCGLKQNLINFRLEKFLSATATVTRRVDLVSNSTRRLLVMLSTLTNVKNCFWQLLPSHSFLGNTKLGGPLQTSSVHILSEVRGEGQSTGSVGIVVLFIT